MGKSPPAGKRGRNRDFALTDRQVKKLIGTTTNRRIKSALVMMAEGHSVKEIAPLLGVSSVTLWRWVKKTATKCFPEMEHDRLPFPESLRRRREDGE